MVRSSAFGTDGAKNHPPIELRYRRRRLPDAGSTITLLGSRPSTPLRISPRDRLACNSSGRCRPNLRVCESSGVPLGSNRDPADLDRACRTSRPGAKPRDYYRSLPAGSRQRLSIAPGRYRPAHDRGADEMTTGLDPQARRATLKLSADPDRGVTIGPGHHFNEEAIGSATASP